MHAGKARRVSENNSKCRRYFQSKNRKKNNRKLKNFVEVFSWKKKKDQQFLLLTSRSHTTNTISEWNFLMVESGKNIFSLIFWKHGAVNEFYGAIDISFQMRGAKFPVIRGLEKLKFLHTG